MTPPLLTVQRDPRTVGEGTPPLLLLLHGYGSDEADLMGLADDLDPRLRAVSARAPLTLDMGGYAWFPVEFTPVGLVADYEEGERSLRRLEGLLWQLQRTYGNGGGDTYTLGFSQGGAMALGLTLAMPAAVAGCAFLSGLWSRERMPRDGAARAAMKGKPVLQTHGLADPLIPIGRARSARALLEELEVDLTYREYDMGHQIGAACLDDIGAWLRQRLDGP